MALSFSHFTLVLLLSCFSSSFLLCHGFPALHHRHHPRFASHNYRDALTKSILFFEGQRSGKLPSNQRISWRRDSGLSDGAAMHVCIFSLYSPLFFGLFSFCLLTWAWKWKMQVDLVGGYYDAGDNVKFGFPMAFTTTMLSWSVIEFGGLMKGELQNAKTAIRWATDYLLKATVHPDIIYVQVSILCSAFSIWNVGDHNNDFWVCFCRLVMQTRIILVGRDQKIWIPQEVFSK